MLNATRRLHKIKRNQNNNTTMKLFTLFTLSIVTVLLSSFPVQVEREASNLGGSYAEVAYEAASWICYKSLCMTSPENCVWCKDSPWSTGHCAAPAPEDHV